MGDRSRRIRKEAAREYQSLAVHDLSIFCRQRFAGDAGKTFSAISFHDQIRLGYSVVQYLREVSDKLQFVEIDF